MTWLKKRSGQSTVETAVLFTCVIGGLLFMAGYVQRATQGGMKGNADSIGQQFSTSTPFQSVSLQDSITDVNHTGSSQCSDFEQTLGNGALTSAGCNVTAMPSSAPTNAPTL